jgi:mannose-1-phosphate guanylyltransferase/phosphomannomutase
LLNKAGCDVVVLNASLRQVLPTVGEREVLLKQLGSVVQALNAGLGVQVAANGEQLIVVDETGNAIQGERLTALMIDISLQTNPQGTVVIPVHASSAIEIIARRHNAHIIRTKVNPTALMEACHKNPGVIIGGSAETGFIFPQLHPGFDAMIAIAKLIEMLTLHPQTISQLHAALPTVYYQTQTLRCPWNHKGTLMRHLVETHPIKQLEMVDGIKIKHPTEPENWILILPDADEPLVHLIANGVEQAWVENTLIDYQQRVHHFEAIENTLNLGSSKP